MIQRTWHDGGKILDSIIEKKFLDHSGQFLSVGANMGNDWSWPLLSQGWSGVLVEPDPFACSKLIDNCQQWNDRVQIINSAVSPHGGLSNLHLSRKSSWYSSLNHDWQLKMMKIRMKHDPKQYNNDLEHIYKVLTNTITMQDIADQLGTDFRLIVIDTEGMDSEIVLSTDWNQFNKCELISIEHEFPEVEPHLDVIKCLESFGFSFTDQDHAHAIYQRNIIK
jgi:FkbM family methyltransferase